MSRKRRGKGEGGVYQRADGMWCASVSLGYDGDGKRIRRTIYGATKGDVLEKMAKVQQDVASGLNVRPERITVGEHFEDWLRSRRADVRETTQQNYELYYNLYIKPTFDRLRLSSLDYRRINAWYESLDKKGLSNRTVSYAAYLLRVSLDDAVRKGLIPANPSRLAAKRSTKKDEARCLTPDETKRFIAACKNVRLGDAFIFAVYTGLRPGEWMGLSWRDVDLDTDKLSVRQGLAWTDEGPVLNPPKTKAGRRTLTMPRAATDALRRQKKRQAEERLAAGPKWSNAWDLIFTDQLGRPLRSPNVRQRDFAVVCREAKIDDAHPHTLRHTNASLLIAQGIRPKTIAERLGHEDIRTTLQTYGHLMPGDDETAAAALDRLAETL